KHGAQACAGIITARCANVDLYLFHKFMRLAVGTNKLDSSARYGQVTAVRALCRVQGTHRWPVTFEDIVSAEALLLVGTNITEANPITGLKVKEAVKKHGAVLLTVESLQPAVGTISNIANLASHHFTAHPDQYKPVVLGLIKAVIEEGLVHQPLAQQAPGYLQAISGALQQLSWPAIEQATGSTAAAIKDAARAFAKTAKAVIVIGAGVLREPGASSLATTLQDLLLLTGHHGRPGCGLAPLAEQNNDQGAVEMGTVAECLPGPCDLGDQEARARTSTLWKEELPQGPGRTIPEILQEARTKTVKALYLIGENPAGSLPDSVGVKEALEGLEFLVCQELFLTETAQLAHVVLPACSYAEKDGTFTNTEGHVQQVRRAIEPVGESRPDWEIFSALAGQMGYPLEYGDAKEILKEIRALIPGYSVPGPMPKPSRPDDSAVVRYLKQGYADDLVERYGYAQPPTKAAGRLILVVDQFLFHSGKFSTKAKGLLHLQVAGALYLNPSDAARLGIAEGDRVLISNEWGQCLTTAKVWDRLPAGLCRFPKHFDQEARRLLPVSIDVVTGALYYRSAQVKVERL
ncbi:MAG: molybdopterin oxidoreductase family protein, partial [Nitrospiraceae bacterium]